MKWLAGCEGPAESAVHPRSILSRPLTSAQGGTQRGRGLPVPERPGDLTSPPPENRMRRLHSTAAQAGVLAGQVSVSDEFRSRA